MFSRSFVAATTTTVLMSPLVLISSNAFQLASRNCKGQRMKICHDDTEDDDGSASSTRRSFFLRKVPSLIGAISLLPLLTSSSSVSATTPSAMFGRMNLNKPSLTPPSPQHQAFYSNLFGALCQESSAGENVLVSPFSIAQSLAMVADGATPKSTCETELLQTLGISSSQDVIKSTKAIVSKKSAGDDGVTLTTANSIWTKGLKPSYIRQVEKDHGAAAKQLPGTYEPIDAWINDSTKGLLSNVMGKECIDPLVVGLLVNVVHFKGSWLHQFDASRNAAGNFHTVNNQQQLNATFMHAKRKMAVATSLPHLGKATALRLDYGRKPKKDTKSSGAAATFAAMLLLPETNTAESMASLIQGLQSPGSIENTLGSLGGGGPTNTNREVALSLPRFRIEWGAASLQKCLRRLGINLAFDAGQTGNEKDAMFSRMTSNPTVHLDDVIHKSVMEVTEEGTVAAAATAAVMMARSLPPPPLVLEFNRPFVMLVVHVPTSTPLFMARVEQPQLSF